jgi:hypothetical protein
MDDGYYIMSRRVVCTKCRHHFTPTSKEALQKMPPFIQGMFPAVTSYRTGLDERVVQMLVAGCDGGLGPSAVYSMIREFYTAKHARKERGYYEAIKMLLETQRKSQGVCQYRIRDAKVQCPKFSSFGDPTGYNGKFPSGNRDSESYTTSFIKRKCVAKYLGTMFQLSIARMRSYFDFEVQRRSGEFYSIDHSHKVCIFKPLRD